MKNVLNSGIMQNIFSHIHMKNSLMFLSGLLRKIIKQNNLKIYYLFHNKKQY